VLRAQSIPALMHVCVEGIVGEFGVLHAQVTAGRRFLAEAGVCGEDCVVWRFVLNGGRDEKINLMMQLAPSEDLMLLRQQFVDVVAMIRQAVLRIEELERERRHAREDALTKVHNRRSIEVELCDALRDVESSGVSMSVMMIDIDNFKSINDDFGHAVGDEILVLAAQCLRQQIRQYDCVGRWGGDEFVVLLRGMEVEQAVHVADRVAQAFRENPASRSVTMSIGIADTSMVDVKGTEGLAALLAAADIGLYRGKRHGRNQIHVVNVA